MLTEGQSYGFPSVAVNITPKTNHFSAFQPVKKPAARTPICPGTARKILEGDYDISQISYRKQSM